MEALLFKRTRLGRRTWHYPLPVAQASVHAQVTLMHTPAASSALALRRRGEDLGAGEKIQARAWAIEPDAGRALGGSNARVFRLGKGSWMDGDGDGLGTRAPVGGFVFGGGGTNVRRNAGPDFSCRIGLGGEFVIKPTSFSLALRSASLLATRDSSAPARPPKSKERKKKRARRGVPTIWTHMLHLRTYTRASPYVPKLVNTTLGLAPPLRAPCPAWPTVWT